MEAMATKEEIKKMQKEAQEFASFLVRNEITFKSETNECDNDTAIYFDIEAKDNKKVTFFFKDNGYVGIEVKNGKES